VSLGVISGATATIRTAKTSTGALAWPATTGQVDVGTSRT